MNHPLLEHVINTLDSYAVVLDPSSRVLARNSAFYSGLSPHCRDCVLGLSPGKIIDLVRSAGPFEGSETLATCRSCQTRLSALPHQRKSPEHNGDWTLVVQHLGARGRQHLRLRATPLGATSADYMLFTMQPVPEPSVLAKSPRDTVDKGLSKFSEWPGWADLINTKVDSDESARHVFTGLMNLTDRLIQHQMLRAAEEGTLTLRNTWLQPDEILWKLEPGLTEQASKLRRDLRIYHAPNATALYTDAAVLTRVLLNMIHNAIEASDPGERVTVWYGEADSGPAFFVQNPAIMAENHAARVFERGYSRHGDSERGFGAYGMKLFGERLLGGRVDFRTSPFHGTVFWISLPSPPA